MTKPAIFCSSCTCLTWMKKCTSTNLAQLPSARIAARVGPEADIRKLIAPHRSSIVRVKC